MNAPIDILAAMRAHGIRAIHDFPSYDRVAVTLADGRVGNGPTVGKALEAAQRDTWLADRVAA